MCLIQFVMIASLCDGNGWLGNLKKLSAKAYLENWDFWRTNHPQPGRNIQKQPPEWHWLPYCRGGSPTYQFIRLHGCYLIGIAVSSASSRLGIYPCRWIKAATDWHHAATKPTLTKLPLGPVPTKPQKLQFSRKSIATSLII